MDKKEIDFLTDIILNINKEVSEFKAGYFNTNGRGTFQAILSKRQYIDDDKHYVVYVLESLQKSHCFFDGNKRSSNNFFSLLCVFYGFTAIKLDVLADVQLLYIEGKITRQEFVDTVISNHIK